MKQATWIKWISIVLIAGAVFWVMTILSDPLVRPLQNWVVATRPWSYIAYGAFYVVAAVALVPGSFLTIVAGALGLLWGVIVVSISATTAAALAFLIARYLARPKVEEVARRNPKFRALDRAIEEGGWRIVGLMRLSPAIPFNLQNYFFGLTSIGFWPYVMTSWAAMLPGTFLYVYIGYVIFGMPGETRQRTVWEWVALGAGLAATAAVTVYITVLARKKLKSEAAIPIDEEAPVEPTARPTRSTVSGSVITAAVALFAIVGAVYVHFNRTEIRAAVGEWVGGLFGPPRVVLKEVYERQPSGPSFDHSVFNELLIAHVDEEGWVDYVGLLANQSQLDRYLDRLAAAPFDELGRDEKLALLINAYNAFTLRLILDYWDAGRLRSIQDISDDKRWKDRRWKVGRYTWSLDQIEHEQIRPKFRDARVHFALVCAAAGCPPLRREAYVASRIDDQLQDQGNYVHHHNRWFRFDHEENVAHLTELYKWYRDDFEQVAGSIVAYAAQYSEDLKTALDAEAEVTVQFIPYDWSLNSQANRREQPNG